MRHMSLAQHFGSSGWAGSMEPEPEPPARVRQTGGRPRYAKSEAEARPPRGSLRQGLGPPLVRVVIVVEEVHLGGADTSSNGTVEAWLKVAGAHRQIPTQSYPLPGTHHCGAGCPSWLG